MAGSKRKINVSALSLFMMLLVLLGMVCGADGKLILNLIDFRDVFTQSYGYGLILSSDQQEGKLQYYHNNQIATLTGIDEVVFSPSKEYFALRYDYDPGNIQYRYELRRTADNQLLVSEDTIPYQTNQSTLIFSPQEKHLFMAASDTSERLYSTKNGELLNTFMDSESVEFSPDDTYYLVHDHRFGMVTRLYHGRVIMTLNRRGYMVSFSANSRYFIVRTMYENPEVYLLWYYGGNPDDLYLLADLGPDMAGHFFDVDAQQITVWYPDNRAYLIDLAWLVAMHANPSTELMELARRPFMRKDSLFNEADLAPYLDGQTPLACQEK
jgi:hypothetical protein